MLNSIDNRALVIAAFPNLQNDPDFVISGKQTPDYNCIAWAGGYDNVWWEAVPLKSRPIKRFDGVTVDWPFGVAPDWKLSTLIAIFKNLGYNSCADGTNEEGFSKVCFYSLNGDDVTHAAKEYATGSDKGKWSSKLGPSFRITHGIPCAIEGQIYGNVLHYMKRSWP